MSQLKRLWPAALLTAITLLAYGRVMNAGFIWDDPGHVMRNEPLFSSPSALLRIWFEPGDTQQYYPMTFTIFRAQSRLWGWSPAGYHLVNILLHIVNAQLTVLLVSQLGLPLPWLVGLLFALHPVQVESVAWISELKNVLSTFFYLVSLTCLIPLLLQKGKRRLDNQIGVSWSATYAFSLVLFSLALASKSTASSLPAAALVICWWKRGRLRLTDLVVIPFFALGIASGVGTAILERWSIGAQGVSWNLSLAERVLIAGKAVWFYAGKLIWPYPLAFIYTRWIVNVRDPLQWIFPSTALGLGGALYSWRRSLGRGPLAAYLLFVGTLFPALGFIDTYPMIYSFVADHFQYLACLPLFAGFAYLVHKAASVSGHPIRVSGAITGVLVLSLASRVWIETAKYVDEKALWLDTIRKNPTGWMPHSNLAAILWSDGDGVAAQEHLRMAVAQNPPTYTVYDSLGLIEAKNSRPDKAEYWYRQALEREPDMPVLHKHLGDVLLAQNQLDAALARYQTSLNLIGARWLVRSPTYSDRLKGEELIAVLNDDIAGIFARRRRWTEARKYLLRGLEAKPDSVNLNRHLGTVLKALEQKR